MNRNRSKIIGICIYISGMLMFFFYLIFSNQIMVALDKTLSKVTEITMTEWYSMILQDGELVVKEDQLRAAGETVHFGLYECTINDDKMDSMTIYGIAACESSIENFNRKVKVVLCGEKHIYLVDTVLENAVGNGFLANYNLQGTNNNFITSFSTINIREDTYRIGLYVWENEEVSGYIDLWRIYEKNGNTFQERIPGEVEPMTSNDDSEVYLSMGDNSASLSEGYYTIIGLAAKPNYNSIRSDVFINFIFEDGENRTFSTRLSPNFWYNNQLQSQLYTYCRFEAKIPEDVLKGKTAQVQVFVENNGISTYQEENFIYTFTEEGCQEIYVSPLNDFTYKKDAGSLVNHVSVCGLDTYYEDCYHLKGIAWIGGHPIDYPNIYVQFVCENGVAYTYPAVVSRNEWLTTVADERYANATYAVKISKNDFGPENVQMFILIKEDETVYRSESIQYIWQGDQFVQK